MSEHSHSKTLEELGEDLPSYEHRMSIAAIAQLFRRHSLQNALKLVLDGLENKRFSIYVREDLEELKPLISRSYFMKDPELQIRAFLLIEDILNPYIDEETSEMLKGFQTVAQELKTQIRFELRNRITPYLDFSWADMPDHPEWN